MAGVKKRSLSRQKIIKKAIKFADKNGIEQLSMRKLASGLKVEAMSLYNHVENRADLISAMVNEVFLSIKWDDSLQWQEAMRDRAIATKKVYDLHPWMVVVSNSNKNPGPDLLDSHEKVLNCLVLAGFSLRMAAHALSALDAYIAGFVMTEQSLPADTDLEFKELAVLMLSTIPKKRYPRLNELMEKHVLSPEYSYSDEFIFGLDLILDRLESKL